MITETITCDKCHDVILGTIPHFRVEVSNYSSGVETKRLDFCGYCAVEHLGILVSGLPRRVKR